MEGSVKPFYKMTYFTGMRGRAEVIRMMFRLAGVEYIDERVSLEDWQKGKKAGERRNSYYLFIY
jgi:hypothetical protein